MLNKIDLFPIPVYKVKCQQHEEIKDYLYKHVKPKFDQDGPNGGKQTIFTDYLPGSGAMIYWPFILEKYKEDVHPILEEIGYDLSLDWQIKMKGWYNFTNYNEEEWVHDHTGGASNINYSFVHYIEVDGQDNGTIFLNPNYKMIRATAPTKNTNYLPYSFFEDRVQIEIEEGDILFFPSWLDHTAPEHTSGNLRVTNAVNLMMRMTKNDEDGF